MTNAFGNCELTDGMHFSSVVTYVIQMFIEVVTLVMERRCGTIHYYAVS
jgi:hypothetical protein